MCVLCTNVNWRAKAIDCLYVDHTAPCFFLPCNPCNPPAAVELGSARGFPTVASAALDIPVGRAGIFAADIASARRTRHQRPALSSR